jgi:hypothetical protein
LRIRAGFDTINIFIRQPIADLTCRTGRADLQKYKS